jgi:hypothetical protein
MRINRALSHAISLVPVSGARDLMSPLPACIGGGRGMLRVAPSLRDGGGGGSHLRILASVMVDSQFL